MLRTALASSGPALVEVLVDPNERPAEPDQVMAAEKK
jgi:thiamine pyrophosphate-dependent acetolactate synthase large subunit-like protein